MGEAFAGQSAPDNPMKPEPVGGEVDELDDELDLEDDDVEDEREAMAERQVDLNGVRANVRVGRSVSSKVRRREVKPTATPPRVNANAGGSDCTPDDFTTGDLVWSVVAKKKHWGVKVTSLTTSGSINVNPTPSRPTDPTGPNTPNPVSGGNITEDNWSDVRASLTEYHTRKGGRGPWHDTAASTAHEWAHWDTDWMKNCLGTTWPTYRRKMERLKVPKSTAATANDARAALQPLVEAKLTALDRAATKKWNKVPDSPGDFFANGYLAGQAVLDKHVKKLDSYVTKEGWNLLGKIKKALTPGGGAAAAAATP